MEIKKKVIPDYSILQIKEKIGFLSLTEMENAVSKWAWIEALKVVAEHIDDNGNIDPEYGLELKKYLEVK